MLGSRCRFPLLLSACLFACDNLGSLRTDAEIPDGGPDTLEIDKLDSPPASVPLTP